VWSDNDDPTLLWNEGVIVGALSLRISQRLKVASSAAATGGVMRERI
jgi:hypothetical protein